MERHSVQVACTSTADHKLQPWPSSQTSGIHLGFKSPARGLGMPKARSRPKRCVPPRPVPTRQPSFKYGTCPIQGLARKPHVFGKGSGKAGRGAHVCSKFWKRAHGQPECWHFEFVSSGTVSELWTKRYREWYFSLENRLARGGR